MKLSGEGGGPSHLVDRRLTLLRRLYPRTSPDPAQFLFVLTAKPRREKFRELQMSSCKWNKKKLQQNKQGMNEGFMEVKYHGEERAQYSDEEFKGSVSG